MGTTLAEKVWADHLVRKGSDGAPDLLYIDLMLMHEVTSPQAFEGLRLAGRKPRHVDQLIATEDHNTPTVDIDRPNPDETSALQLSTLEKNCKDFGVRLCPLGDADQGVVHAFAPVLGLTQPGMTIVCGDSHTSTHGAFGAMAIGIGTSEVEHVMATQTLSLKPFKTMAVNIEATCRRASPPRILFWPSSRRSAPAAARATLSNTVAKHQEAVDGRPHDHLQHVHRSRRPRRHDRPGRGDFRIPEGPSARAGR